ncbi:hypothetical protein [Scytonema sp. NUACC21]
MKDHFLVILIQHRDRGPNTLVILTYVQLWAAKDTEVLMPSFSIL